MSTFVPAREAVELSVEDSGPGIPAAERERVLARFYRAGESLAPGSGLGLAIVQSIAQLHGASLSAGPVAAAGRLARDGALSEPPDSLSRA